MSTEKKTEHLEKAYFQFIKEKKELNADFNIVKTKRLHRNKEPLAVLENRIDNIYKSDLATDTDFATLDLI